MKEMLIGENAFYNSQDYEMLTKQEMASSKLKLAYTYNTEKKIWRVVKDILSVIIFPIGLYRFIHSIAGKIIVPASTAFFVSSDIADSCRQAINLKGNWKVKRISVEVDGYLIDAVIMGKASTLGNGRWVLSSNGNAEFYEYKLHSYSFKSILSELNSNAIFFNYPGVGSSSGMPNRSAMSKAYRAMLNFLEDQEKGIGATEIIGYGLSIGGGVQGDALLSHELKQNVKYIFIKDRTFSDLSTAATHLTNRCLGFLVKILGWNMNSIESSKKLKASEIIIQRAKVSSYTDISGQPDKVINDGVISADASLAKKLLSEKPQFLGKKYFLGIPECHNDNLTNPSHLIEKINNM